MNEEAGDYFQKGTFQVSEKPKTCPGRGLNPLPSVSAGSAEHRGLPPRRPHSPAPPARGLLHGRDPLPGRGTREVLRSRRLREDDPQARQLRPGPGGVQRQDLPTRQGPGHTRGDGHRLLQRSHR